MAESTLIECSFFIPARRDAILSDGLPHHADMWEKLDEAMYGRFEAGTVAPGSYKGFYCDPDTGNRVDDESTRFIVAIPEGKLDALKEMLRAACVWFQQKCIYLSIAGKVEFLRAD